MSYLRNKNYVIITHPDVISNPYSFFFPWKKKKSDKTDP